MKNPKPFLEFAWRIELALRVMKTFSVDHLRVDEPLEGAMQVFRDLVSGKMEVQIMAAPGRLFINDEPLELSTDVNVAHLHQQMSERSVAGVVLGRAMEGDELRALLGFLAMHPQKAAAQGGALQFLSQARVRHIKLAEARYEVVKAGEAVGSLGQVAEARSSPKSTLDSKQYDLIRQKILASGLSLEHLDDHLGLMSWDELNQVDRLNLLLERDRIFEVPLDLVLEFLRDILEAGKPEGFSQVMAHLGTGLFAESSHRRQRVSEQFVGLADLAVDPGLTQKLELELAQLLRNHFAQERDPKLHQFTCDALVLLLGHWLETGDLDHLNALVHDLAGSPLLWVPGTKIWKSESLQKVLEMLSRKDRLVSLLPFLYEMKREDLMKKVYPLLARMGESAAKTLVFFLDGATTQSQRRRLIEAIRAIGDPAIPALRKALESPHWHLVRNAINTLRDLGGHPSIADLGRCLFHSDVRVRAAAARALRDLGGGTLLLEAFPTVAADTQVEVALGLGQLHYLPAVPAIAELASGRGPIRYRLEAIKALGLMGSQEAMQVLAGLLKSKGLLSASEPPEIRLGAARALVAIGFPDSLAILDQAVASSHGDLKDALLKIQAGKE